MADGPVRERLLPSLLDRLTDDDPLNNSIDLLRQRIQRLEKALFDSGKRTARDVDDGQRQQLLDELNGERAQYLALTAAVSSLSEIRDCVKRDLDWLFNTHSYSPAEQLDIYPEVQSSVINYGMPDLSGKTASGIDTYQLEKMIRQVIINYEPRLMPQTLDVRLLADQDAMNNRALIFEIECEMWSEPLPIHLHLRTEMELESGSVSVKDF